MVVLYLSLIHIYFGVGLSDTVKENDLPVFEQASAWLDAYFAKAPLPALPPLAPDVYKRQP